MEHFFIDLSIVMIGSAVLAWVTSKIHQPIIVAYILCGIICGPWGLKWVSNVEFVEGISGLGITLLLFLAGTVLHPRHFLHSFRRNSIATVLGCFFLFSMVFIFSLIWKFSISNALLIGIALMFSSTILVVKLLPTTTLHQERMGAICISILVAEDIIAIFVLTLLHAGKIGAMPLDFLMMVIKSAIVLSFAIIFEQFVLRKVMAGMDAFHESLFVTGIAWCLGMAVLAAWIGLSPEIGAFFAGLALARSKISLFISEKLKPLRDFFIVLFFFALGAKLDLFVMGEILVPAILLAALFVAAAPYLLSYAFRIAGIDKKASKEAGLRFGQNSEFALLIAVLAYNMNMITKEASHLIQLVTIITMIVSSFIVVRNLETPLAATEKLRRD